jgi:hypothetical protein
MTNAAPRKTSGRYQLAAVYLLGGVAGLVAPFLLIAACGYFSFLIDPHARILGFLLRPPHHPVRLAIAGIALPLFFGASAGIGLCLLTGRLPRPNRWLVWLIFIGGFIASILISAPGFHPLPVTGLWRFSAFLVASMITLRWAMPPQLSRPINQL